MSQTKEGRSRRDGVITAVAFGGFLIIVGAIFALTPNLWQRINDFFGSITTTTVPGSSIVLPAPDQAAAHKILYTAVLQFDVAFGVFQLLILALRVWMKSRIGRIAETLGNAVFWLGAALVTNTFLLEGTLRGWFNFWETLIVVVGFSLIARALVLFARRT